MPYQDPKKQREYLRNYMRERQRKQKVQRVADKHKLEAYQTNSQLKQDSTTQKRLGERRFATDSVGSMEGESLSLAEANRNTQLEACAEKRMKQFGESPEEAWIKCEKGVRVNRDVKTIPRSFATDKKQPVKKVDKGKHVPKVLEKTFCGFCLQMHPTKILCADGTIKSFPLNTFHVLPQMRIDSLGLTREATNMERCVSAIMDVRGVSEEEAAGVCKQLLEDPIFKHDFINQPKVRKSTDILFEETKEDRYAAAWVSLNKDKHPEMCHPEIGALIFHKEEKEAAARIASVDKTVEGLDDIYGKTRAEILAESMPESKYSGRLTVGDIKRQKAVAKAKRERLLKEEEEEVKSSGE